MISSIQEFYVLYQLDCDCAGVDRRTTGILDALGGLFKGIFVGIFFLLFFAWATAHLAVRAAAFCVASNRLASLAEQGRAPLLQPP